MESKINEMANNWKTVLQAETYTENENLITVHALFELCTERECTIELHKLGVAVMEKFEDIRGFEVNEILNNEIYFKIA